MKVRLQSPSGTELSPFNPILPPAAITQVMLLANPLKVKLSLNVSFYSFMCLFMLLIFVHVDCQKSRFTNWLHMKAYSIFISYIENAKDEVCLRMLLN